MDGHLGKRVQRDSPTFDFPDIKSAKRAFPLSKPAYRASPTRVLPDNKRAKRASSRASARSARAHRAMVIFGKIMTSFIYQKKSDLSFEVPEFWCKVVIHTRHFCSWIRQMY